MIDQSQPPMLIGDVASGLAAWLSFNGFFKQELEVGLLSEVAAAISIIWFLARFAGWLFSVLRKRKAVCKCGKNCGCRK